MDAGSATSEDDADAGAGELDAASPSGTCGSPDAGQADGSATEAGVDAQLAGDAASDPDAANDAQVDTGANFPDAAEDALVPPSDAASDAPHMPSSPDACVP